MQANNLQEAELLELLQKLVSTAFQEGRAGVPWANSKARQAVRRFEWMKSDGQTPESHPKGPADTDGRKKGNNRGNRRTLEVRGREGNHSNNRPNR